VKDEIVQYLIFRRDLNMSPGKIAAQAGHAAVGAVVLVRDYGGLEERDYLDAWLNSSHTKIALGVDSNEELQALSEKLDQGDWLHFRVVDEGRNEIPQGSLTCVGVQPLPKSEIRDLVKYLKLL
jgi:PTH2 family peptidyl-tRNA hydrolase